MRLTEARIKNFKGIEEWNLKFQPGFNLLKGDNGTGKTSVLDALALGLDSFSSWAARNAGIVFADSNIRMEYQRQGDGSAAPQYFFPSEISLTADFLEEKRTLVWTRSQNIQPGTKGVPGQLDSGEIVIFSKNRANDITKTLPVLCYLSVPALRMEILADNIDYLFDLIKRNPARLSKFHQYRQSLKSLGRMNGYADNLSGFSGVNPILEWFNQMERVRLQKGKEIREYEAVKRAAAAFMEAMEPGKKFHVFYDNQLSDLLCEVKNGKTLPIHNYSAGYQSLIWMVLDIAWRMAQLNPFLLDKITDTPGVVLIDELDLHLHPKWQWRVIDALRTTFPNVQFIAATHAPILFASTNDVWIVNLDGDEPSYQWSRYGLDINTAVSEYQGDYTLPERVQKIAGEVSDAINREDYSEAEKKLKELEQEVAPKPGENGGSAFLGDPPLLTELRARYDIESSWPEE